MSTRFTRWLGLALVGGLWLICSLQHARAQTTVEAAPATYIRFDNPTNHFVVLPPKDNSFDLFHTYSRVTTADRQQIGSAVLVPVPGMPGRTMPVAVAPAGMANNTMGGYLGAWPGRSMEVLMQQCFAGGYAWNMQGSVADTAHKGYTFTSAARWNEFAWNQATAQLTKLENFTSSWLVAFPRPQGTFLDYRDATVGEVQEKKYPAVPQDPFTRGGAKYNLAQRIFESPIYASADKLTAGNNVNLYGNNNMRRIRGPNPNQFAVLAAFSPDSDRFAANIERVYNQLRDEGVSGRNIAVLYGNMARGYLPAFPDLGLAGNTVLNDGRNTLANFQNLLSGNAATWRGFGGNVPDANSNLFVYTTGHGLGFRPNGARLMPVNRGRAPRPGLGNADFAVDYAPNPDNLPMTTLQISTTAPISAIQLASDQVSIDGIAVGTLSPATPTPVTDVSEYVGPTYTYDLKFPSVDDAASINGAPVLVDIAGLKSGLDSLQNNAVVAITLDDGDGTIITTVAPVPEPSTFALLATGLVGLLGYGWRRGKRSRPDQALPCVPRATKERKPGFFSDRILLGVAICLLIGEAVPLRAGPIRPLLDMDLDTLQLPKEVDELNKAIESFQKGDYEQCLQLLQAAGKKRADLLPPRLILAKLFLVNNQAKQGRAALEQAAVESPEHPEIYLVFGRLALQEGRLTDARLHFGTAIELARLNKWPAKLRQEFLRDAHAGRAGEAEQRQGWPDAEAALTAWLKLEPKTGAARQRLGAALFRQGKFDQGRIELEQAVRDDPKLEPAAITLGRLYTEIGQLDKAARWMEAAVKNAPKDFRAHLGHARWLLEQGRAGEARQAGDAAARLAPEAQECQFLCGLIARTLKDCARAERLFQELHQQSPGEFAFSNQLALALGEQADEAKRRKALQLAEINARLYPNSGKALSTLGRVYYRLGRTDEAEKALRASLSGGAGSSDTVYYLARLLAERGQAEEAKRLLKLALDAPGLFAFRKEAREQLDRLEKKP